MHNSEHQKSVKKRWTKNIKKYIKKNFLNSPAGRMHKHHLVHHQCLQNNMTLEIHYSWLLNNKSHGTSSLNCQSSFKMSLTAHFVTYRLSDAGFNTATITATATACVARWPSGYGAGLATNRSRVRILSAALPSASLGKLFTHVCLCHRAV